MRSRRLGRRRLGLRRGAGLSALDRHCFLFDSKFMGALVGPFSELHVDIAEIGVDDRIGPHLQRADQRLARVVEPAELGVEHGEVVVRLEHGGMVVAKVLEDGDRLDEISFAGVQHALQQAHAGRVGIAREHVLDRLARFRVAFLRNQGKSVVDGTLSERGGTHHRPQHAARDRRPPEPCHGWHF